MVENLITILGGVKVITSAIFGAYYYKNREGMHPFPENPLPKEDVYVSKQNKILEKYEKNLEARINYDKVC